MDFTTTQSLAPVANNDFPQVPPAPKLRAQQAPCDFQFNMQLASQDQFSNGNCNTALCSASNCSVSEALSQNGSSYQ
jgi:hypothetical protein